MTASRIMCFGKDTGPNGGPCENLATCKNAMGQHVCDHCYQISESVLELFHQLRMDGIASDVFARVPLPTARSN